MVCKALRMLTVLLIDDSAVVRKLGGKVLAADYTVLVASDGTSALRMFRRNVARIGVVLLDAVLPDVSGEDLYLRLRELAPATPVVVTSALRPCELPPALRLADAFVAKPWTKLEIMRAIGEVTARAPDS